MSTIIDGAIVAGHCDGAIMVVESGVSATEFSKR